MKRRFAEDSLAYTLKHARREFFPRLAARNCAARQTRDCIGALGRNLISVELHSASLRGCHAAPTNGYNFARVCNAERGTKRPSFGGTANSTREIPRRETRLVSPRRCHEEFKTDQGRLQRCLRAVSIAASLYRKLEIGVTAIMFTEINTRRVSKIELARGTMFRRVFARGIRKQQNSETQGSFVRYFDSPRNFAIISLDSGWVGFGFGLPPASGCR